MSSTGQLALRIVCTTNNRSSIYPSFLTSVYCIDRLYKLLFNNVCGLIDLHPFIIL